MKRNFNENRDALNCLLEEKGMRKYVVFISYAQWRSQLDHSLPLRKFQIIIIVFS